MIVNAAVFTCSICGEPSTEICAYCTKDVCANHRCIRCNRCSDCCECDVPLLAEEPISEDPKADESESPVDGAAAAHEESLPPLTPEAPAESSGPTIADDSADSEPGL